MKGLYQFEGFDFMAFARDKDFSVTGVGQWLDYESKKPMGWKVETVIIRDDTQYRVKDGKVISNLYQSQVFKCTSKPDVKPGDIVTPDGDMTCVLYGPYRNQLSVKCARVVLADGKAG